MIRRYIFILFALAAAADAAQAQTKPAQKKPTAKTVQKKPVSKPAAKSIGAAAATVKQDTTKKGNNNQNNNSSNNGSLSEEIVVTTVYKPVLSDAVKIRRNPNLEDTQPYKAPLTYNALLDKKLERNSDIRQLVAMKMPAERDSVLDNNLVRAGLGSLKTTFGEFYLNNGRDQALQVGAYGKHLAQSGTLYKQNESRDEVGVFGKSIGDVNSLSGRITYNRLGTYYYGSTNTLVPLADPIKQTYNTIGAEGELTKNYQDTDRVFTYALKLKGYLFSNAFDTRESNVVLSGFMNQTIKQFYAGLAASIDVANQKDFSYSLNNSMLRVNPYLKFQGESYKIDAGVNIVQQFGFSNKFYIFPAAKLELQIIPKFARLFAEAKGDVNRTSLRGLAGQNPFIDQDLNIINSVDKLDITVGLKGRLLAGLGFKAAIFRNSIENLPMFVSLGNLQSGYNRFGVVYANGRTRVSGFNGELDYKASDDLDIFGRVEIKDYSLSDQASAVMDVWNLPKFKLTAGTTIHISDKVDINGSLLFRDKVKDRIISNVLSSSQPYEMVSLKSFADLSGGVNYKATKHLSVFVQVNNILNANYQTYLYYPNYGFNIFGGAGFSF